MNEQLSKLFRNAAVYGFGRILGKVISFLLIPFYTHYFSAAEYGVMEVLNLTMTIAAVLMAPGLSTAVMRFYYDSDDPKEKKLAISTGLILTLITGGAVALLAILFPDGPAQLLLGSTKYRTLVQLAACGLFFNFSSDIGWVYLRGKQRSWLYTLLTQGFLLGSVSLNVYFVAVRKLGVAGSFWANIVVGGIVWVILVSMTVRDAGLHINLSKVFKLVKFGAPLFTVWMAAFVLNFSDRFFLQRFYGIEAVGVYAVGYKFAYILSLLVVQPFQLMWEPQSYEISKRDDAKGLFSQIFVLYSVLLIAVASMLTLVIREVFEVMVDAKFVTAYHFVPLIAFAYVVQGMGLYFEAGLLIRKKNVTLSLIGLAATIVCLGLNLVLIRQWAAWGAAWATFLSFTFLSAACFWYSSRAYEFSIGFSKILKALGAGAALMICGYLLSAQPLEVRIAAKSALLAIFMFALTRMGILPAGLVSSMWRGGVEWIRGLLAPIFGSKNNGSGTAAVGNPVRGEN